MPRGTGEKFKLADITEKNYLRKRAMAQELKQEEYPLQNI